VSIGRYHTHQEAHTDPMLPKITDEIIEREEAARADRLPPLAKPRVPRLDDDWLAELIAELDGDDATRPAPAPERTSRPVIPRPSVPRPRTTIEFPAGALPPTPRPPVEPGREPLARGDAVRAEPVQPRPPRVEPTRTRPSGPELVRDEPDDEPEEQFGPDDDPSVLRLSGDGPVLRSRYGDFRPPVALGRRRKGQRRAPDPTSLTGLSLTSRSNGRIGSRLFALFFAAIFLLILSEVVIGLVSAAATP
jgi:hypothetical protein